MQKNYMIPQTEVMQLSSEVIMDGINVVHHSGGSNGGGPGSFPEEQII